MGLFTVRRIICYCILLLVVSTIGLLHFHFVSLKKHHSPYTLEDQQEALENDRDFIHSALHEVFYVWCASKRHFEFRHFLSVRSVFRFLQPNRVVFYYENEPAQDKNGYHTWLTELRDQYPFFSLHKLDTKWCSNLRQKVDDYLFQNGGVFVREDVVFVQPFDERFLLLNYLAVEDEKNQNAGAVKLVQMSRRKYKLQTGNSSLVCETSIKLIRGVTPIKDSQIFGGKIRTVSDMPANAAANVNPDTNKIMIFLAESSFFPKDIWELNSTTGKLLRSVAYDTEDFARAAPNYNNLAPNIAHVIWTNDDPMSFSFYLCVLSLLEVACVDKLYLHGDGPPSGVYWNLVKNHTKLLLVRRRPMKGQFEFVYGNHVKVRAHVTDVWRADILNRYGGLYIDTDAMFLKPLDEEIRAYDAVASHDVSRRGSFPETYQNGILLGKRGAMFWRLHLESMKVYIDNDWLWNSCFQMYKIKERHPTLLHIEPRLNTICNHGKCFPFWTPRNKSHANEPKETGRLTYWVKETYAMHHTYPDLPEFSSYKALLANNGSTLLGQAGIYVLKRAGMFDFFQTIVQQNRTL